MGAVVVANNYWGAATGPKPDPADDVCRGTGSSMTATPFATGAFKIRPPLKP